MKHSILVAIVLLAATGSASAGGQPGSIGVGAEYQLSGLGGVSFNYDAGLFHAGGFLGFNDPEDDNNTTFDIGGRFYYHIASTAMSDFSLGGGLGISHFSAGEGTTVMYLEPGFQIRAFVAANVALSFTAGISIGTFDRSDVVVTGDATGTAGVHYYF